MIAQRYPHDFDAIIVGYAASNETGIGAIQFPYLAQSSTYANGSYILTIADIQALHAGAVAACDGNDGLVDGLVNPAYKCDFDPIAILCSRNKTTNCLANMDKVTAARKMYTYPSNSRTNKLIDSRYVPGSEIEWATWTNAYGGDFATSFTMNAAFQQDLPLNWTLAEYDWESYPYMVGPMEDIYGVGDADLSIFRDKGGKIIHYQGWADANVAPMWNLNYYKK
jgi:feruloyl esterase